MPTNDHPHAFDLYRLRAAVAGDFQTHPAAYPILARYGYMERTVNGYKDIGGPAVVDRCRQLIAQLSREKT